MIDPHPPVDRPGPRRRAREAGRAHALAWRVVGAANLADSFAVLALSIVDCPHRFCTYGMAIARRVLDVIPSAAASPIDSIGLIV